jgi:hypothetical protein
VRERERERERERVMLLSCKGVFGFLFCWLSEGGGEERKRQKVLVFSGSCWNLC